MLLQEPVVLQEPVDEISSSGSSMSSSVSEDDNFTFAREALEREVPTFYLHTPHGGEHRNIEDGLG
jgi:hypothetical protein